jgi:hypothetical protein
MRHETLVTKYDYDLENDSIFFYGSNQKYFEALIDVNEENIRLTMKMGVSKRNKLIDTGLQALGLNSMNLPISTQEVALNC